MRSGYLCPDSLPVMSPWFSDLNDSLLLFFQILEAIHSHFSGPMDDNGPRFLYHPSMSPQHSTYIFITELYINKPPSTYSNLRVPSASYRNSTRYTLIYREHSMVPQEKWSKISSYHLILLKMQNIHMILNNYTTVSKYGSSQSRNVWTKHVFCSLLII